MCGMAGKSPQAENEDVRTSGPLVWPSTEISATCKNFHATLLAYSLAVKLGKIR
jgi:hypothetical protein